MAIEGLPPSTKANVQLEGGPAMLSRTISASRSLELEAGDYELAAGQVLVSSQVYAPTVAVTPVDIVVGTTATVTIVYELDDEDPIPVDPTGVRIVGPDPGGYFGWDVDLADDVAIVGAPNEDGAFQGAAYVYRRGDDGWTEDARFELAPSEGRPLSWFGSGVAIEGSFAVVGAMGANDDAGAAWVYEYAGGKWSAGTELVCDPPGAEGSAAARGTEVALSADRVALSAPGFPGFVCLFEFDGDKWSESEVIQPDSVKTEIGLSLSLDGDVLEFTTASPAFSFAHTTAGWSGGVLPQSTDDKAWPPRAVSRAGDLVAFGHPTYPGSGSNSGRVVLSSRSGAFEPRFLTPDDSTANQSFGETLSADSGRILIGAPTTENDPEDGAAYIFDDKGDELDKLVATDAEGDLGFGQAVALSGKTALVGAWRHPGGGTADTGAVYFFQLP